MSDSPKSNSVESPTKPRPKSAYYDRDLGNLSFTIRKTVHEIYGIENGLSVEGLTIEQVILLSLNFFACYKTETIQMEANSPAEQAKLEIGDRIVSINGKPVETRAEVQELLLEAENEVYIGLFRPPVIQSPSRSASVDSCLQAVTLQNNSNILNEGIR